MMSSSYPTSYQRIDHRTVYKNLQLQGKNNSQETLADGDILRPITASSHNVRVKGNYDVNTTRTTIFRADTTPRTAVTAAHLTKSKIPYPLTKIWTKHKNTFNTESSSPSGDTICRSDIRVLSGGDGSLRLRGSKSNSLLIAKPLEYETATKVKCNTHDKRETTSLTGGRLFHTRRKLVLISQKPLADPLLKRSQTLRKNFKTDSPNQQQNYQTPQQQAKSCAATKSNGTIKTTKITLNSISAHDVEQQHKTTTTLINHNNSNNMSNKDQGDGTQDIDNNMEEQQHQKEQQQQQQQKEQQKQLSPDALEANSDKLIKECQKLSLNHNGVHSSSATTLTLATITEAATVQQQQQQQEHHHQQQHSPHARPFTLATSASTPLTTGGGVDILKTPRSPKTTTAIPGPENKTPLLHQRQHHQHHNQQQQQQQLQAKISPDCKPTPKTPPVTPDSPTSYLDDDLDSLYSYTTTSGRSTMSCEHPYVARNGTTFSGRKMKYVVHCSNYAGQVGADYLTPTQRAQRQIRRLKELLCVARQDLEQKDSEILRLTREVVELRLFKASLSSPDERSASSDAVTVREAELKTSQDVSPIVDMVDDGPQKNSNMQSPHHHSHHHQHHEHHVHGGGGGGGVVMHAASESPTAMLHHHSQHLSQNSHHHHHHHHVMHDMQSSFADSGHFEDMTSSSVHSKSSSSCDHSIAHGHGGHGHDQACGGVVVGEGGVHHNDGEEPSASTMAQYELQRQELIRMYEQRIEDLVRSQDAVTSDMKRSNNDRIEALLQKLAECNTRYADIVPDYEHAKERIRELEKQLEDLQRKLIEHEEKQKQMYLHMYQKGQEAERIARADQALELAHRAPQNNKVSINELLHQLQSTQDELENIRAAECRKECGSNHALLTAKEAISLWVLGARKTIYRRLLEAQKNRTHVDPEVTLQFLKSAVYYFLTDKENSQGHLQAIESILEFSEAEKQNINKARNTK